jgi:hypothetical protein
MTAEECNIVYDTLVSTLDISGLQWIVSQVEEQLRLGKTVEKEIRTLTEGRSRDTLQGFEEYREHLRSGPKATFPITIEYEPKEKLSLLIEAIEQAVIDTAEMENHIIEFFGKDLLSLESVAFYPDEGDKETVSINRQSAASRHVHGANLKQLFEILRKEI